MGHSDRANNMLYLLRRAGRPLTIEELLTTARAAGVPLGHRLRLAAVFAVLQASGLAERVVEPGAPPRMRATGRRRQLAARPRTPIVDFGAHVLECLVDAGRPLTPRELAVQSFRLLLHLGDEGAIRKRLNGNRDWSAFGFEWDAAAGVARLLADPAPVPADARMTGLIEAAPATIERMLDLLERGVRVNERLAELLERLDPDALAARIAAQLRVVPAPGRSNRTTGTTGGRR